MARFTARWLEIAQDQYYSLPDDHQRAIETRVAGLLERPEGPAGAYHRGCDQWTTTYGAGLGLIVYAISDDRNRVLILRLVRSPDHAQKSFSHSGSDTPIVDAIVRTGELGKRSSRSLPRACVGSDRY